MMMMMMMMMVTQTFQHNLHAADFLNGIAA